MLQMNLFSAAESEVANLLPYDGTVYYYGEVLAPERADDYFDQLYERLSWQHDQALIAGTLLKTTRRVAWYGDKAYRYTYSGTTKEARIWTDALRALKKTIEEKTGYSYNSCLANFYEDGEVGMAWHSDNEYMLGKNTCIASLSLGAVRTFSFKHKQTKEVVSIKLLPGSLLVMKDETQSHWLHSLPKTKKVKSARINLTFRTIVE
jgi:alkylated DNA repair dioxygenase AlkB